jgi:hypothetical protein
VWPPIVVRKPKKEASAEPDPLDVLEGGIAARSKKKTSRTGPTGGSSFVPARPVPVPSVKPKPVAEQPAKVVKDASGKVHLVAVVEAEPEAEEENDDFAPSDASDGDSVSDDSTADEVPDDGIDAAPSPPPMAPLPPLPAAEPPPPLPPPGPAHGRNARAVPWEGFQIAEVWTGGRHIGYGITCGRHPGTTSCKKQITFGIEGLTALQCQFALKRWLLRGMAAPPAPPVTRILHVGFSARDCVRDDNEANAAEREADLVGRVRAFLDAHG